MDLLHKLKEKREEIAHREGKELYMIFRNQTLEDTIQEMPETKQELLNIKGWGKKKMKKYGDEILAVLHNRDNNNSGRGTLFDVALEESQKPKEERVFTVDAYLNFVNIGLRKSEARVKGEISSLKIKDSYIIFGLIDESGESFMNCFMWRNDYELQDFDIEKGEEVIISGYPKIYERTGQFSFQTQAIEPVGEGALKKAYDKLRKKLEEEGLFAEERKRPFPDFPKKIGVVTSLRGGTVIHDFESNLGKFGFKIKAIDARVEGKWAVKSLLKAIEHMKKIDVDVLVVIRGGGSIETLQAFDNEALVRAVVNFPKPVLAGIGHHKDITLLSLAADAMVSTPTGAAEFLNNSWEEARHTVRLHERELFDLCKETLSETRDRIDFFSNNLRRGFKKILSSFQKIEAGFRDSVSNLSHTIGNFKQRICEIGKLVNTALERMIEKAREKISLAGQSIIAYNPERQLKLGYSIVSFNDKIIRSVKKVKKGDEIDIQVSDGIIEGEVRRTKNQENKKL